MFYSQKNLFRALQLHILLIILWVNYMQEYQGKVLSLKTAWWWQGKTFRPLFDTWITYLPSVSTGTWVFICAKYSEGYVFKHFTVNMAWYSSEDIFLLISPWIPWNYKVQCWNCKISFAVFPLFLHGPTFPWLLCMTSASVMDEGSSMEKKMGGRDKKHHLEKTDVQCLFV